MEHIAPIRKTLANGVQLGFLQLPHLHTVSLWIVAPGGVAYETSANNGISHAVEHLHFSVTQSHRTRLELARAFDRIALDANAFVEEDSISFMTKVPPEHAATAVDLLSECMLSREFDPEIIAGELKLLAVELATGGYKPSNPLVPMLFRGHAYGLPPGGTPTSTRLLRADEIHEFSRRALAPDQLSIGVAGAFDATLIERSTSAFSKLAAGTTERLQRASAPELRLPRFQRVQSGRAAGVTLAFNLPAPVSRETWNACRLIAFGVSSISAELRNELRYGLHAVYHGEIDVFSIGGSAMLFANVPTRPNDLDRVIGTILRALMQAIAETPPDWFETARNRAVASLAALSDDSLQIARAIAYEVGPTRPELQRSIAGEFAWLKAVQWSDIRAVARQVFRRENFAIAFSARTRILDARRIRNLVQSIVP